MTALTVFIYNLLAIISLGIIGVFLELKLSRKISLWCWGVLFGLITMLSAREPLLLAPNCYFDFEHINLVLAGFIGGLPASLAAAGISAIDLTVREVETIAGFLSILVFSGLGCYLHRRHRSQTIKNQKPGRWLGWGLVIAILNLLLQLIAFPAGKDLITAGPKTLILFLVLSLIMVFILFNVFILVQDSSRKIHILNALFKDTPLNLILFNSQETLMASDSFRRDDTVSKYLQDPWRLLNGQNPRIDSLTNFLKDDSLIATEIETNQGQALSVNLIPLTSPSGDKSVFGIVEDITERKRLQNELKHLDWLNLLGQVAAGIAHEIRNPMTTIKGFLQMLGEKENGQKKEYFQLMLDELDRANDIIAEFLTMAEDKPVDQEVDNLNRLLDTLHPLILADATDAGVKISFVQNQLPNMPVNRNEIRQLILNLVRNGLESMPNGGTLVIKTYQKNQDVVLSVKDNGAGIKPEVMKRLGTPFFSTKEYGTGLGLAVCYAIARRHNAVIDVRTTPQGSTFFVRFKPAATAW